MQRSLRPDHPTPGCPLLDDGAFAWVDTPVGPISLLAGPEGLRASWLQAHPFESIDALGADLDPALPSTAHLKEAREQIRAYFRGERRSFDLALSPAGTPFQLRVWQALSAIPHGEAISYGELAKRCGSPQAYRAVGGANGRNPIPLIIPCHRVIAADGTIGGFSSGIERKRAMLALEGVGVK